MNSKDFCLDLNRKNRIGMVEAVWGEDKTPSQIAEILNEFQLNGEKVFVTRVSEKKALQVAELVEGVEFHPLAKCLTIGSPPVIQKDLGKVFLLSGGTSDVFVASEAGLALRWHAVETECVIDVGVAGLHRLLDQLDRLKEAKVLIAFAGMEGSLPTVLAGLVPQPVIGVPVSIGYGVSAGGRTALESMLASCAPGLLVVNIDNGYGAAMAALRILLS